VPGHSRHFDVRQLVVDDMKIRSTDATGSDANQHLARSNARNLSLPSVDDARSVPRERHREHRPYLTKKSIVMIQPTTMTNQRT
jgi:hypothetical protein